MKAGEIAELVFRILGYIILVTAFLGLIWAGIEGISKGLQERKKRKSTKIEK